MLQRYINFRHLIIILILVTVLPFFLIFFDLDFSISETNRELFVFSLKMTSASLIGLVGVVLIFWQMILGNRYLSNFISFDVLDANKIHKFLGKYILIFLILHPLLIISAYNWDPITMLLPNFSSEFYKHVSIGVFSLWILLFIWVTSAIFHKVLKYQHWQILHYSSYIFLIFSILHSKDIGRYITKFPFLTLLWNVLLVLAITLVVFRVLLASGIFYKRFKIISKNSINESTIVLKLKLLSGKLNFKNGQFVYLQLNRFGESHPFSAAIVDEEKGELTLAIKKFGNFTKSLDSIIEGQEVFLDGGYGVFTSEADNQGPNVFIAGGIGITPFIGKILKSNFDNYLFYSSKLLSDAIFVEEFREKLKNNFFLCISGEKLEREDIIPNRISFELICEGISDLVKIKNAKFFICGNSNFIEGITTTLEGNGIEKGKIYTEKFY